MSRHRAFRFGADDPELAARIIEAYEQDGPEARAIIEAMTTDETPPGNAAKGFAAILIILAACVLMLAATVFILGFLAHAAVAGWDAL